MDVQFGLSIRENQYSSYNADLHPIKNTVACKKLVTVIWFTANMFSSTHKQRRSLQKNYRFSLIVEWHCKMPNLSDTRSMVRLSEKLFLFICARAWIFSRKQSRLRLFRSVNKSTSFQPTIIILNSMVGLIS